MSASETVVFTNYSGSDEWFEIANASHDVVQFKNTGTVKQIAVGESQPAAGIELSAGTFPYLRIENANTKVWALIGPSGSLPVIRGSARMCAIG
jgi:hypothetical protein